MVRAIGALLLLLGACQRTPSPGVTRWTLTPVWELSDSLAHPESALFDPGAGVIYVSNINGSPVEKDGMAISVAFRPKAFCSKPTG